METSCTTCMAPNECPICGGCKGHGASVELVEAILEVVEIFKGHYLDNLSLKKENNGKERAND